MNYISSGQSLWIWIFGAQKFFEISDKFENNFINFLGWRALLATRIGDIEECCDTGLYEDRQICVMNKPIK